MTSFNHGNGGEFGDCLSPGSEQTSNSRNPAELGRAAGSL